jgi:fimbrial chaperone protein
LTLGNDSNDVLRFQLSAFAWDEDASGRMRLAPTDDVVFFPMMLTVSPGEERRIRVGSTAGSGEIEKTYRIFVEELPPGPGSPERLEGSQIRVLTKMGIPVFVQPLRPKADTSVEILGVADERLRFLVRNTGNTHVLLQDVHIQGTGVTGIRVLDRRVEGWYLLAGRERAFEQALSGSECAGLSSVAIDAGTDRGTWTARRELPPPACVPSAARAASGSPE